MLKNQAKNEKLPMYIAMNPQQMLEELETQGLLGLKPEEGLQDDLANAYRLFTDINERGDLMQGLTDGKGRPASFMDLMQTMDLRGVLWNYGLGYISALKGGYNIAMNDARQKAESQKQGYTDRRMIDNHLIRYFIEKYNQYQTNKEIAKEPKRKVKMPKIDFKYKVYD